ncbi:MAG: O-antigen ligase family protein [Chromatiales bacterium]|nr:O-antigen ligase family protein [Chromatiales bacterium]
MIRILIQKQYKMAAKKKGKHSSKQTTKTGLSKKEESSNLTLEHSKVISEIPPAYVWSLGSFIALVAVFAPIGQTPFGYNPDLYMASMLQVGALVFLSVYLYLMYRNKSPGILIPRVSFLLFSVAAFYLWMVVSLFWAHNFYEAIVKVLDWGAAIIIFFVVLLSLRDRRLIFPMVFCLYCGSVLISLLGVGQYLLSIDWVPQHISPAATFGNKNMNGEFLILTWVLGVGLFINSRNIKASWFYSLGSAFALASLFYGRTRGSWFSFIVEIIVFAILLIYLKYGLAHKYQWQMPKIIAALGFVLLTFALINTTPKFFVSTVPILEKNTGGIEQETNPVGGAVQGESSADVVKKAKETYAATKQQRIIMWKNSFNLLKDHWLLGVGIGNWMVYYPKYQESYAVDPALRGESLFHINAHSDYVEFISELGLVGMFLMLWVTGAVLLGIFYVFSKKSKLREEDQVMVMVCFVALMGIASNASVSFPLQQPITIAITMIYVAILTAATWHAFSPNEQSFYRWRISSPTLNVVVASSAVLATIAMLALQIIWYQSDTLHFKAVSNYRSGNYKTAFESAQESYENFPIRKRTMYHIGDYYYRNKKYDKALPIFEEMREHYPYRRQILNALAGVYLETGRIEEFESLMNNWIEDGSQSASIHLTKAIAKIRENNSAEALRILESAKNLPGSQQTKERIETLTQKLYNAMEVAEAERLKARHKAKRRAKYLAERRAEKAARKKAN